MIALLFSVALLLIPILLIGINTAIHWPRTQPRKRGHGKVPGLLSMRALIDEVVATALLLLGPLSTLVPARSTTAANRRATIALIPERRLPKSATWLLQRRLRGAGWNVVGSSKVKNPGTSEAIDHLATEISEKCPPGPITLIGFGRAGLIARQIASKYNRFERILTLATPHQGTFAKSLTGDVHPKSAYISLVNEADPRQRKFDGIALYSDGDAWLDPTDGAYYPGAFNIEVHGVGHFSLLFSDQVFRYIAENLEADLPSEDTL